MFKLAIFCIALAGFASAGTIPEYIHICKRSDPHVNKCIIDSVEVLRPRLKKGIPELDVPSLEPLYINDIVIARGNGPSNFKAILKNVDVFGASDFQITKLKLDVPNHTYRIGVKIPVLTLIGDYDVDARILIVPIKGHGKFSANATNCIGQVVLKGNLETRNGVEHIIFESMQLSLKIGDYNVNLENLFSGEPILGQAANDILNENKGDFIEISTPFIERKASEILLDIANKIVKNFSYDEVFPEK